MTDKKPEGEFLRYQVVRGRKEMAPEDFDAALNRYVSQNDKTAFVAGGSVGVFVCILVAVMLDGLGKILDLIARHFF